MRTPWRCPDCGANGVVHHKSGATPEDIIRWTEAQHNQKSPRCADDAAFAKRACFPAVVRLTARDRHILVTVRVKRKLMADSWRAQRKTDSKACRAQWLRTKKKALRGYAVT